ncbi:unnamed protein product [Bemisia tabaci]|uniref:T-box domain-containing protein n=1 Tax=Bemisia tabaci TaxID=7038 RepID=A0A9P0G2B8_BEMTA|nr:PREDICTED: T-box-containing protein TBX6L-like [Bemisia tabaci]CAH0753328.1 unnamed protein product [Bemisia tabaci]
MSPMSGPVTIHGAPEGCSREMKNVKVSLSNKPLWDQFHQHHNEMIITKTGRRMFPSLQLEVSGLDPEARYFVMLEMSLSSGSRFKYSKSEWLPVGNAEPQLSPQTRIALHPDSPARGSYWTSQPILFNKIRLTNNTMDQAGNIILTSMHKYLPCIHIVKASNLLAIPWSPTAVFSFKETEFTAVTAYQNDAITKLKIDNNPFAKGFRETGQSKTKRKIKLPSDFDEPEPKRRDSDRTISPAQDDSGISSISSTPPPQIDDEDEYIDVIGTDDSTDKGEPLCQNNESIQYPNAQRHILPSPYPYVPYPYSLPYYPCPPTYNPLSQNCFSRFSYLPPIPNIPPVYPSLPYPTYDRPFNTLVPTPQESHRYSPSYLNQNLIDLRTNVKNVSDCS